MDKTTLNDVLAASFRYQRGSEELPAVELVQIGDLADVEWALLPVNGFVEWALLPVNGFVEWALLPVNGFVEWALLPVNGMDVDQEWPTYI